MFEEKEMRKRILLLLAGCLLCVFVTWLSILLTNPPLTEPAVRIWTITEPEAAYQDKININTATLDELCYAEGVGTVTAQKILDYLQAHGPITQIEELDAVDGIGEKRLEELKKIFYAT